MRGKNMFGGGKFGGGMIFKTEVVNGVCPTCEAATVFISICPSMYRCTNCGSDLQQKVNGVIQYIPAVSPGGKIPVLASLDDGPPKA
jgi:tRNA(Ile2) C34 agmatinyltransferase TiaS